MGFVISYGRRGRVKKSLTSALEIVLLVGFGGASEDGLDLLMSDLIDMMQYQIGVRNLLLEKLDNLIGAAANLDVISNPISSACPLFQCLNCG